MRVLNLTPGFAPFSKLNHYNQVPPVQIAVDDLWSGGEIKLRLDPASCYGKEFLITTRLNNSHDIMKLFMATNALKQFTDSIELFVPYLPYARQDRICNYGEPFSLKVLADLINLQEYSKVMVFDPHSNVAELLIENMEAQDNFIFVREVVSNLNRPLTIVSPDAGSFKKGQALVSYLNNPEFYDLDHSFEHLPCLKTRNKETGAIDQYMLPEFDLKDKECLIADDVADGGRTFVALTQRLKDRGASKVYLAVSHGIFSNGYSFLIENGIDHIYSTDSIHTSDPDFLKEMKNIYTEIKLEDII